MYGVVSPTTLLLGNLAYTTATVVCAHERGWAECVLFVHDVCVCVCGQHMYCLDGSVHACCNSMCTQNDNKTNNMKARELSFHVSSR